MLSGLAEKSVSGAVSGGASFLTDGPVLSTQRVATKKPGELGRGKSSAAKPDVMILIPGAHMVEGSPTYIHTNK